MHTACLLTVSQHALLGGVPAGGVPAQGVYLSRVAGTYLGGCTCGGWWCTCQGRGCTCMGGVSTQGVYLPGEGGVPARDGYLHRYSPLWTEWQTGAKILPCPKLPFACGNYDLGEHVTFLVCECAAFFQCGTARIRSVYCGTEKVCEYRSS